MSRRGARSEKLNNYSTNETILRSNDKMPLFLHNLMHSVVVDAFMALILTTNIYHIWPIFRRSVLYLFFKKTCESLVTAMNWSFFKKNYGSCCKMKGQTHKDNNKMMCIFFSKVNYTWHCLLAVLPWQENRAKKWLQTLWLLLLEESSKREEKRASACHCQLKLKPAS